jgi:iron complex transport system ATP-binding protein
MNNPILHISELSVGYAQKCVLEGVNLKLDAGQLYILVGNNGAGKSTLLKTLVGQLSPVAGTCQLINNSQALDLCAIPSYERAKWISYVPARHHYTEGIRVMDVLHIGRTPYLNQFGTITAIDKEKIDQVVDAFSLRLWLDKPLNTLSDGEQQKVRIARVVLQDTPFIILDETYFTFGHASEEKNIQLAQSIMHGWKNHYLCHPRFAFGTTFCPRNTNGQR